MIRFAIYLPLAIIVVVGPFWLAAMALVTGDLLRRAEGGRP